MRNERSPLKDNPLRSPGESLDRKIQSVFDDNVMPYFLAAMVLVLLAFMEWMRLLRGSPPQPWLFSMLALAAVGATTWRIRRAIREVRNLKLGRDGEKAVGQFLERFRESGGKVFHDVPAQSFNLDHVLIHETGIYVIETKTLSKPVRGEARLLYDGQRVTRKGFTQDRDPVRQVRAARAWLLETLKESTGKRFSALAVLAYPGWFIEQVGGAERSDVQVLNPRMLPALIASRRSTLSREDVHLCAYHLSRYIRSYSG